MAGSLPVDHSCISRLGTRIALEYLLDLSKGGPCDGQKELASGPTSLWFARNAPKADEADE
jgi:hypothetical protein